MKRFAFMLCSTMLFSFLLQSCCSKKSTCPVLSFDQLELSGFDAGDVSDSVSLITYEYGSNFSSKVDSIPIYAQTTEDNDRFRFNVPAISLKYEYRVWVGKISQNYNIGNFGTEKVECGKCFMRNNNKYGYELTDYSVNTKPYDFTGIIRVHK